MTFDSAARLYHEARPEHRTRPRPGHHARGRRQLRHADDDRCPCLHRGSPVVPRRAYRRRHARGNTVIHRDHARQLPVPVPRPRLRPRRHGRNPHRAVTALASKREQVSVRRSFAPLLSSRPRQTQVRSGISIRALPAGITNRVGRFRRLRLHLTQCAVPGIYTFADDGYSLFRRSPDARSHSGLDLYTPMFAPCLLGCPGIGWQRPSLSGRVSRMSGTYLRWYGRKGAGSGGESLNTAADS